jgi:hypothetical protein
MSKSYKINDHQTRVDFLSLLYTCPNNERGRTNTTKQLLLLEFEEVQKLRYMLIQIEDSNDRLEKPFWVNKKIRTRLNTRE